LHIPRLPAATLAALLLGALSLAGCGDSLRAIGPTPAAAIANADALFDAMQTRFTNVELAPRYYAAKQRIGEQALTPSRVFDDTSVWVAEPSPTSRAFYASGDWVSGHYRMELRPSLTPAARIGDARHAITLERLGPSVYRWRTNVEMALGTISAQQMSVLISSMFRAADGRSERALRAEYAAALPHATAAFGHGFTIDSLRTTPGADGTTAVSLTVGFQPELMRAAYPQLAKYLDKYLGPAKYRATLADRGGAALLDVVGRDRKMTLRYRVQHGAGLVPLAGAPRPWPDTLVFTADVSLKVKIFTVGFRHLVTDFVITNAPHERAMTFIARREPEWDLPFITERLIRAALRRPFMGEGAMFSLGVRDGGGVGQTLLERGARLDVQESALVRFLGSLAAHAVGDLDAKVEAEEDQFIRDGFAALREDLAAARSALGDGAQ
jgi:hypothetical protein